VSLAAAPAPPAEQVLREKGLTPSGKVLLLGEESDPELKARLADFRELLARYRGTVGRLDAVLSVDGEIATVDANVRDLEHSRNELNSNIDMLLRDKGNNPRWKLNNAERASLEGWESDRDACNARINDLVRHRRELAASLPPPPERRKIEEAARSQSGAFLRRAGLLREAVDKVVLRYDELRQDPAVTKAVAEFRGGAGAGRSRLGPSDDFLRLARELAAAEALVRSTSVKAERSGGFYRVEAVFNSRGPEAAVLDPGLTLTTVPAGVAKRIGLTPPAGPEQNPPRRWRATLASVRLEALTLVNVACEVLPDGTGDDPVRLGKNALQRLVCRFDPEHDALLIARPFDRPPRRPNR
jgi:hypothetical protein